MKSLKSLLFIVVLMALGLGNIHAQYVTTHAKAAIPGQQNGIFYSLPRTVIQLHFIIEETQLKEGPYSNYVSLIGADDYIMEDETVYHIKDVKVEASAESDPNATFFVAISPKKGEAASFCLNGQGILKGVGVECVEDPKKECCAKTCEDDNNAQDGDFKYQYSNASIRGSDQMARSAAEMINKIRDEKLKLMTGFQETAFNLDTYRQMYADLETMENDYLSLFVGKRVVKTYVKTVYVIQNKEVNTMSVAKFSPEEGLSVGLGGNGSVITVQTQSLQTTATLNAPSQSAVESLNLDNKLFYRIPEMANVRVNMDDKLLAEKRMSVAQLGVFMLAPLGGTKLTLDPMTGQVVSMGMQ